MKTMNKKLRAALQADSLPGRVLCETGEILITKPAVRGSYYVPALTMCQAVFQAWGKEPRLGISRQNP